MSTKPDGIVVFEVDPAASIEGLMAVLSKYRFRHATEKALQAALSAALDENGIAHEREVAISARDVVDFRLAGGLVIEVKVGGSLPDLTRQVYRCLRNDTVSAVVVVTNQAKLSQLPPTMRGKPVGVIVLAGALS